MKNKAKKIIVGVVVAGALAGGGLAGNEIYVQKQIGDMRDVFVNRGIEASEAEAISRYFHGREGYITIKQRKQLIEAYNKQIQEIRRDCEKDVRCNKGKVNLGNPKSKRELMGNLNKYILEDWETPNKYKINE